MICPPGGARLSSHKAVHRPDARSVAPAVRARNATVSKPADCKVQRRTNPPDDRRSAMDAIAHESYASSRSSPPSSPPAASSPTRPSSRSGRTPSANSSDCGADRLSLRPGSSRRLSAKPPAPGTTIPAMSTTWSRRARSRSRTGADKSGSTPRERPLKPPKAASIAPTTWGARMRSNTTCSSARQAGPSASTFPTTSTGAARPAPSPNAGRAVGSAFNHPAPFANQGACVAYVNHRKRITLLVPEDPIQ